MIKLSHTEVWAFDVEWAPDPSTGRAVYSLGDDTKDSDVLQRMWDEGGASEENPRPFLKTVLCRIVSVAVVIRKAVRNSVPQLTLYSLPRPDDPNMQESALLERFLGKIGESQPQLVGFNSHSSDVPALVQRALVHGLSLPKFCKRPNKPWEGVDYFARGSDMHIDLLEECGSWGKGNPSLHEMATACGIPGKIGVTGEDISVLWQSGDIRRIVEYNEYDALTTYLLWLRLVHLAGFVTTDQYKGEQEELERTLTAKSQEAEGAHLHHYIQEWQRLRKVRT